MYKKVGVFLIILVLFILSMSSVYADGEVITDIRFGRSDWANNLKAGHPVFKSGSYGYNINSGNHDKITLIESSDNLHDFYVQYNYDLRRYRLAIAKGDITLDLYIDTDSWYEDPTIGYDNWERPDFEIWYGYTDDRHNLERQVEWDTGSSNSGGTFSWTKTLPNNTKYVMINFDTEFEDNGGHGFAARYRNPYVYFEDNVAPRVKNVWSGSYSGDHNQPVKIGESAYINLYFDEVVSVDNNSKLKLNVIDKFGNPVYADFISVEENANDCRVQYAYTVKEGDYIPVNYPNNYLTADISSVSTGQIRDLAGNPFGGGVDTVNFRKGVIVDGSYPTVYIATPPVDGYQNSFSTIVTVSEDFPGAGLPNSFKYVWSTNSSVSNTDPIWSDNTKYSWFNN